MKTIKYITLFVSLINLSAGYAQEKIESVNRDYLITQISETNRYYILESTFQKQKVLLVIFKKSDQLENKKLEIGKNYIFNTYRYFDEISMGERFHEVDGKEIWNTDQYPKIDLHFTDGMGNGYLESRKEVDCDDN